MSKKTTRKPFKLAPERESEDSISHEIFTEVGRTIVQLSNIEDALASIYYHFVASHYGPTPDAMALFYAQPWFDAKIMLVDLAIRFEGPKGFFERWEKIAKEIGQHRKVRNLVAHQRLYVSYPDNEGRVSAWLDPAELNVRYDDKKKMLVPARGRPLSLAEVRSTASALARIRKDLYRLWCDLDQPEPEDE
jgi:hypothetical protein